MRVLAHADLGAVEPDDEHALGRPDVEDDASTGPGRRELERPLVETGRVRLRDVRRAARRTASGRSCTGAGRRCPASSRQPGTTISRQARAGLGVGSREELEAPRAVERQTVGVGDAVDRKAAQLDELGRDPRRSAASARSLAIVRPLASSGCPTRHRPGPDRPRPGRRSRRDRRRAGRRPDASYRALLEVPTLGRILLATAIARIAQSMVGGRPGPVHPPGVRLARAGRARHVRGAVPGPRREPDRGALLDRHGRTRLILLDYVVELVALVAHRAPRPDRRPAAAPARVHRRDHVVHRDPQLHRPAQPVPAPRPAPPLGAGERGRLERLRHRHDHRPAAGGGARRGVRRGGRAHRRWRCRSDSRRCR